jgi:hypothetical protein
MCNENFDGFDILAALFAFFTVVLSLVEVTHVVVQITKNNI